MKKHQISSNVTAFVKRMLALDARIKLTLVWASKPDPKLKGNTYIKSVHGELS